MSIFPIRHKYIILATMEVVAYHNSKVPTCDGLPWFGVGGYGSLIVVIDHIEVVLVEDLW